MKKFNREFLETFFKLSVPMPIKFKELIELLKVTKNKDQLVLDGLLSEMVADGVLTRTKGHRFAYSQSMGLIIGQLSCNSKGAGYVIPEDPSIADIYIARDQMNTAIHLDRVMVKILRHPPKQAAQGTITKVLKRTIHTFVGSYRIQKDLGIMRPDDPKLLFEIIIPPGEALNAVEGQKVIAEITVWETPTLNPIGRVLEILGFADDPDIDEKIVLREFNLNTEFPETVEAEAQRWLNESLEEEYKNRKDLRHLRCMTIDPADAKDFDDALSIQQLKTGFQVGIHIADVSHYVVPGSALDEEAYRRATSVYLVNQVVPMLPHTLSSDLCSLRPHVDRLAMSVLVDMDNDGKIVKSQYFPSVIRSCRRFTYEEVQSLLNKEENPDLTAELTGDLEELDRLAKILRQKRLESGSLELNIPEVQIIMDGNKVRDICVKKRLDSHQLVEEWMLLANQLVAHAMSDKKLPILYRVHDIPDLEKIEQLGNILRSLSLRTNLKEYRNPKSLQKVLKQVENTNFGYLVERILLRTLKKACYQSENIGHYALNFTYYTHFTSPIRRYPDLLVHRMVKQAKLVKKSQKYLKTVHDCIVAWGEHTSELERKAEEAERLSIRLKQIRFMKAHEGDFFDGVISGVTSFGIFIELPHNLAEGMIHLRELTDDYYLFDEKLMALVGKRRRKIYRLGDKIKVQVVNVSIEKKRIDFALVTEKSKQAPEKKEAAQPTEIIKKKRRRKKHVTP